MGLSCDLAREKGLCEVLLVVIRFSGIGAWGFRAGLRAWQSSFQ